MRKTGSTLLHKGSGRSAVPGAVWLACTSGLGFMDRDNTVCIVDDDEAVRDSMRILVESYGHAVRDYPSAMAYLGDERDSEPGCLLLDLHMPGMDGLELVELLRRRHIQTPAIIITGRKNPLQTARVKEAGVIALLNKPVDGDELIGWIEQALGNSSAANGSG